MDIKKVFFTVTPLSKGLALVLVIVFPVVGFLLGLDYKQSLMPEGPIISVSAQKMLHQTAKHPVHL